MSKRAHNVILKHYSKRFEDNEEIKIKNFKDVSLGLVIKTLSNFSFSWCLLVLSLSAPEGPYFHNAGLETLGEISIPRD